MDNDEYDIIICGTGFTESILSGILSMEGKRVLHLERNKFYGGEGASLNLTGLWDMFRNGENPPPQYGHNREWNVDLIPKFIMASGKLVKMLLKTQVSYYLKWKGVEATYVYQYYDGGIFSGGSSSIKKVPATPIEAMSSDLMSLQEKKRCKGFFEYVSSIDLNDINSWKGNNLKEMRFVELASKFKLQDNTIDFIGHAVALYTNDDFHNTSAFMTVERIQLYMMSVGRFGSTPYIYPVYGLGGIPEGFTRKSAVGGGVFMREQDIRGIIVSGGKFKSVHDGQKIAHAEILIAGPTYLLNTGLNEKVIEVGKSIRCICILDHPIPNTNNATSLQIIIPQRQTKRRSDIYITVVSSEHAACHEEYYLAIISTTQETNHPENELKVAFDIVGSVKEKFFSVTPMYVPVSNSVSDNIFVTSSLDPTNTFESAAHDVMRLYKQITGKELDLDDIPDDPNDL